MHYALFIVHIQTMSHFALKYEINHLQSKRKKPSIECETECKEARRKEIESFISFSI